MPKVRKGELIMRDYVCGKCGAQPGEPCRSSSGRQQGYSHSSRFYAARLEGRLPLTEQELEPR